MPAPRGIARQPPGQEQRAGLGGGCPGAPGGLPELQGGRGDAGTDPAVRQRGRRHLRVSHKSKRARVTMVLLR
eukprot:1559841-Alexandrium_andersonii.AAC.1